MKSKIAALTATWGRKDITSLFAQNMKDLGLHVICVGTDGMAEAMEYGWDYIEAPNNPLSEKWQAGLKYAKNFDWTHLLMLGSDDVICDKFKRYYEAMANTGYDFVGVKDMYIHQYGGKTVYWGGYGCHRKGEPGGAGRMLSRKLIEKLHWNLWEGAGNRGLDGVMWGKVRNEHKKITSVKDNKMILCDIKSKESLTSFDHFKHLGEHGINLPINY